MNQLSFTVSHQQDARLRWISLASPATTLDEGAEVVQGLSQTPKTIACRYLYDDRGSQLFEQICTLPEYYPTRTEHAILAAYSLEIAALTGPCELLELGSGSSTKTRLLLEAYRQFGIGTYYPIDVSGGILKTSALQLLEQYPHLQICGLVGTYEAALAQLLVAQTNPGEQDQRSLTFGSLPKLLIFLGSTIGNLAPDAYHNFLSQVRQALKPGDYFLLGVDLQKAIEILEPAYNDSQGITAQFSLNLLNHLNWRFQGNFELQHFSHDAFYNSIEHQIEIYLRSLANQVVTLQALDFSVPILDGEAILIEISRKFHLPTLQTELSTHGLQPIQIWTDPQTWFALVLCQV